MCIAIAKPEGKLIDKDTLKTCFENNSDGAGFAFVDNGELVIKKGFFSFDSFYENFLPHQDKQALIHFRIKTHGPINQDNCHPFQVNDQLAFIHNGIISKAPYDKDRSDTVMFNETMLKPLLKTFGKEVLKNTEVQDLLSGYIGASKLAFIDKETNEFLFVNKQLGNIQNDVWYSNMSWQPRTQYIGNTWGSLSSEYKPSQTSSKWKRKGKTKETLETKDWFLDKNNTICTLGDMIKLTWLYTTSTHSYPVGTVLEIQDIYSDGTLDLYSYSHDKLITGVKQKHVALEGSYSTQGTLYG